MLKQNGLNRKDRETQTSAAGVVSLNQPLLKGVGRGANLANLRKAHLAMLASEYEFRGFAEALVADVERTCWDYVLAQRRISIFQESQKLAEDQLDETRKRIKIGKLAKVEVYAADAEVALRKEDLINSRSDLALTGLRLQRLINSPDGNPMGYSDKYNQQTRCCRAGDQFNTGAYQKGT